MTRNLIYTNAHKIGKLYIVLKLQYTMISNHSVKLLSEIEKKNRFVVQNSNEEMSIWEYRGYHEFWLNLGKRSDLLILGHFWSEYYFIWPALSLTKFA